MDQAKNVKGKSLSTTESIRSCFPLLNNQNHPVYYLDSAASAQKPDRVIKAVIQCYEQQYANVHRGVYRLGEQVTNAYEGTRSLIADFLGGVARHEIIFTSGSTAAVNLVARTWGEKNLKKGDEILLLISEHHSNIVPWQILAKKTGAALKFAPLNENMLPELSLVESMMTEKTKIFSFAHVSNVTGMIYPVKDLTRLARRRGIPTFVDGAQAAPHLEIDVKDLGCDFYCFSGHKLPAPSGIGVLWGKESLLDAMPPFMGGGDMIASVTTEGSTWAELPHKFEAGTPPIAQAIGLGEAIRFLNDTDRAACLNHEKSLSRQIIDEIRDNRGLRLLTNGSGPWIGTVSFHHDHIHPHDMAAFSDARSVCIRAGHHCAQPFMNWLGLSSTTRISPYIYSNETDIRMFLQAYKDAQKIFCP